MSSNECGEYPALTETKAPATLKTGQGLDLGTHLQRQAGVLIPEKLRHDYRWCTKTGVDSPVTRSVSWRGVNAAPGARRTHRSRRG